MDCWLKQPHFAPSQTDWTLRAEYALTNEFAPVKQAVTTHIKGDLHGNMDHHRYTSLSFKFPNKPV